MATDVIVERARRAGAQHSPSRKRLSRYRAATALAGGLLAMLLVAAPAAAQETSGGSGGGPTGGAGGASSATGNGGNGGDHSATGGGGGGGAGVNGGIGGTGENGGGVFPGGAGGAAPGASGNSGGSGPYGAGGGGGAHGYVDTILPTLTDRTGGLGGDGGQGGDYGGGGGAGGYGAVVTGGGGLGTLTVGVTGGRGGIGGVGFLNPFGSGFGTGGQGGHGLVLTAPSTLTIGAAVTGGQGGWPFFSIAGQGGSGIVGGDLDLTVGAAVSGGFSGDGATRGYSLFFNGGANNLTLAAGWSLAGGIFINGGSLTLSPSAELILANDISGSGSFAHTGFGTLVLTGTNTYSGGTTIGTSTLQIGAGGTTGSLGTGDIVNDGNLVFNRSDDIAVSDRISGTGSITKIGPGTLSLTGSNSYQGTTSILGGTLAVNATGLGFTQLVEIGNGATLLGLTGFGLGALSIANGGGTIDTNGVGRVVSISGDVDYGAQLTVTGGGLLFIDDVVGTGSGGINLLSGTLALAGDFSAGEGAILLADGTTLENAAFGCGCGSLILANDIEVTNGGTATINGFGRYTGLDGQLSGGNFRFINGSQFSEGPGGAAAFELTGANSYGNTFIGANVQLVLSGTGTLGTADVEFDSAPSNTPGSPALIFGNDEDYGYEGIIFGNGFVVVGANPAATISLYGSNTSSANFTGTLVVGSGRLNIEGDFGDVVNNAAELIVDNFACGCILPTLGGSGTFHGNITIDNATLAAGSSPGTLNIAGNLALGPGTVLNFEFGRPGVVGNNVNDFVTVAGNLTLDGTLNILNFGPSYGPGYYRLFNYGGTLTDNTLNLGSIDGGLSVNLLFNIPAQVNLLLGPQVIQYWDGADMTGASAGSGTTNGNGGAGTWNATNTNWTAATGFGVNDQWRSTVGIFATTGGTVTVDGTQTFQELRFGTNGYVLTPANSFARLATTGGFSVVDINTGITTDIGVEIQGAAGLTKVGAGTLILSASNTYSGATTIAAGTLQMGANFALSASTAVTVGAGATLDLSSFNGQIGSLAGAGNVQGSGSLDVGIDNTSTIFSGAFSGTVQLSKRGTGTLTLTGSNTLDVLSVYDGGLTISSAGTLNGNVIVYGFAGTPTLINDGTINGSFTAYGGTTDNNGTINGVVENRTNTFVNDGTIRGTGFYTLFNIFGGVFTNNGLIDGRVQNAEFGGGGTLINAGTITGFVENVTGGVINSTGTINGTLNNYGVVSLAGQLNGALINQGNGTATLTGTTTGITSYNGQPGNALLDLAGFDTAIDSISGTGEIRLGSAILTIGANDAFSAFSGVISGSGGLTKVGADVAFLSGVNTYTGLTTVSGGALEISIGGSLAGDVLNNAMFRNFGMVGGTLENNGTGTNDGTIAEFVNNGGTFTTTGIVNPLISGLALTNNVGGTVNAQGQINGLIQNSGIFNVTGQLDGITRFNQFGAAALNLQGNDLILGGLGGSGTVNLGTAFLVVGAGNLNSTFGGVISGSGGLTKIGTDLFTLSGANTYTGQTFVSAGTLIIAGRVGGSVENRAFLAITGDVEGGVLNTATGSATNEAGGDILGGVINHGIFHSAGRIVGGLINTGNFTLRGVVDGDIQNLGGMISLTGPAGPYGRLIQTAGGLFSLSPSFDLTLGSLQGAGEVQLQGRRLTVGGANSNSDFAGIITGSGGSSLVKVGTGTLTLSGSNTYTGTTTVSAGTLTLTSTGRIAGNVLNVATFNNDGRVDLVVDSGGFGSNSGVIAGGVTNTGTFRNTGTIEVGAQNLLGGSFYAQGQINGFVDNRNAFDVTGTLTGITTFLQNSTGQTNLNGWSMMVGALQGSGGINLGNGNGTLTVGDASSTTFSGRITGTGNLTKVGSGTLTLAGANTFTGLTTVSAGQLNVAAGGGLASTLRNNSLMENRGTIGGLVTNNGVMFSYGILGGGLVNDVGGQFNNDTAAIITGAVRNDGRLDNFGTINGIVTNTGQLLSAQAINGGLINSGVALLGGLLNGPLTNNAGSVTLGGTTTGITAVTQLAGALFDLNSFNTSIGSLAGAGEVRLRNAVLTVGSDNSNTLFSGIISGTAASGLTKVGTGTLTLGGANTYGGLTTVSAGILSIASTGQILRGLTNAGGTLVNAGLISNGLVNNGALNSTGIINVGLINTGTAQLRGQLNGFIQNDAGTITLSGVATGIVLLQQAAGATFNLNGFSTSIGTLSGAGSITFGGAVAPAAAGAAAPAADLAPAVFARTPAAQDSAAPDEVAVAAAPPWLVSQESPAPAQIVIADAGDRVAPAPTAATGPSWLVPQSSTGGRASGFGLVVTDSAMASPGAGLTAVESPMARPDGGSLGGNGDTAPIADRNGIAGGPSRAVTDTAGPLVAGLAGGNGDLVVVTPAVIAAAPAAEATLTPAALPPATGPVLTVGAGNVDSLFSGVISGNGRLAKVGTGTLILTGNNTYTDGTLISGGVLQLGNGGTSGSIIGRIENNAILVVNRSDALTLSGIIDGTGMLVQAGTGTTTLTGVNAYTGGTLIQAGRLRGDSLSLQGNIQNNATLEFAQATTGTFAGRLFGAGAVEKTGTGLLTFNTDNSNLTGDTRILGGELRVNGLLSRSRVTVGNGGTLSGTSIVGGIIAQSGGTVAPGSGGFGTLGVNGNIQFLAGSTFAAQVQPAGSDLLLGNGTAQLAGTIAITNAGGVYNFNSVYVLLQADGGRTGTFGTETGLNTFGQAYAPRIVYTPTQVQLLMAPASLVGIAGPDGTPNQRSTLQRIDAAVAAGYNPQPLIALYNLTPRAAFLNGADQLSGEIYATATRVALDDDRLVREATISRLRLTQDIGYGEGFGAWGHAVASWGSGDGDGNAGRYERDQQGFVVGLDGGGVMGGGGSWRLGVLGHQITTDVNVDSRGSNADVERTGVGAYAGLDFGGTRVRLGGTYSWLDLDARRVAAFTAFAETLSGETQGEALQLFGEIGHRFQAGGSTWLEPFVQASYSRIEFDAFNETGGASSVRVAAEEDDLTMLAMGLRGQALWQIGDNSRLRLDGGLGGRLLSGDRMVFSLISLNASPNQAFDIRSAAMDRFSVIGNLDATFEFGRSVSLSIGYSGVIGADSRDHAVRATLGIRF